MKNIRSLSRRFGAYGTQALVLVGGTAATLSAHAAGTAVDVTDTVATSLSCVVIDALKPHVVSCSGRRIHPGGRFPVKSR